MPYKHGEKSTACLAGGCGLGLNEALTKTSNIYSSNLRDAIAAVFPNQVLLVINFRENAACVFVWMVSSH